MNITYFTLIYYIFLLFFIIHNYYYMNITYFTLIYYIFLLLFIDKSMEFKQPKIINAHNTELGKIFMKDKKLVLTVSEINGNINPSRLNYAICKFRNKNNLSIEGFQFCNAYYCGNNFDKCLNDLILLRCQDEFDLNKNEFGMFELLTNEKNNKSAMILILDHSITDGINSQQILNEIIESYKLNTQSNKIRHEPYVKCQRDENIILVPEEIKCSFIRYDVKPDVFKKIRTDSKNKKISFGVFLNGLLQLSLIKVQKKYGQNCRHGNLRIVPHEININLRQFIDQDKIIDENLLIHILTLRQAIPIENENNSFYDFANSVSENFKIYTQEINDTINKNPEELKKLVNKEDKDKGKISSRLAQVNFSSLGKYPYETNFNDLKFNIEKVYTVGRSYYSADGTSKIVFLSTTTNNNLVLIFTHEINNYEFTNDLANEFIKNLNKLYEDENISVKKLLSIDLEVNTASISKY